LRVQIVAEDAEGDRIDVDDLVVEIEDYSDGALVVTPPMVFRGRTARDIAAIRAAERPVPTAGREFSRTERIMLRFGVYGTGAGSAGLTAALLNSRGEAMTVLGAPTTTESGQYEIVVPLGGLPPGDFIIELSASVGDAEARRLLAFRVTG
jgi:hypothetical protein